MFYRACVGFSTMLNIDVKKCGLIVTLFSTCALLTYANGTNREACFCLSEEIAGLRNPIHMEPVTLHGKSVYLVAEQIGTIYAYNPHAKGRKLEIYVDVSNNITVERSAYDERGLLGFAAHKDFKTNGKLYLYSIRTVNNDDYSVISEVTDGNLSTEKYLLLIKQPGKLQNGGQVSALVYGVCFNLTQSCVYFILNLL